ncbi:hypothetical protein VCHA43P277_20028 [Vibrio chagasii]|nr:hypothetical protein VCHA36O157_180058 [Vibrio chagasii]CAH7076282.1 hypothetical protein VCHA41O247_10029 [Vibrio chagasii]CAH7138928.1 hypothetical protein VCHA43P277_20028 [Vibrio chagasii]CAH7329703.1 hypothetical protein VCHA38P217_20031 [Vibrio chagasii]CAH7348493.1 hypothetical protein VCHA57P511_10825 [Vibrio chagasii]
MFCLSACNDLIQFGLTWPNICILLGRKESSSHYFTMYI